LAMEWLSALGDQVSAFGFSEPHKVDCCVGVNCRVGRRRSGRLGWAAQPCRPLRSTQFRKIVEIVRYRAGQAGLQKCALLPSTKPLGASCRNKKAYLGSSYWSSRQSEVVRVGTMRRLGASSETVTKL
jgi:hypothetical protein